MAWKQCNGGYNCEFEVPLEKIMTRERRKKGVEVQRAKSRTQTRAFSVLIRDEEQIGQRRKIHGGSLTVIVCRKAII